MIWTIHAPFPFGEKYPLHSLFIYLFIYSPFAQPHKRPSLRKPIAKCNTTKNPNTPIKLSMGRWLCPSPKLFLENALT